jgi:hypothetical protein
MIGTSNGSFVKIFSRQNCYRSCSIFLFNFRNLLERLLLSIDFDLPQEQHSTIFLSSVSNYKILITNIREDYSITFLTFAVDIFVKICRDTICRALYIYIYSWNWLFCDQNSSTNSILSKNTKGGQLLK